jgi:hypothetical protein
MRRTKQHVFAVVRVDEFHTPDVPWNIRVTVKEIVMSEQEARLEVQRLNDLKKDKRCIYFWQVTRLVQGGT